MTKKSNSFSNQFGILCVAFGKPIDLSIGAVYFNLLETLPHILKIMDMASKGDFGFDPKFLPNVPQLIEAHDRYEKEVEAKKGNENADKFGLPEGSFMSKSEWNEKFLKTRKWLNEAPNGKNPFIYAHEKLEKEAKGE